MRVASIDNILACAEEDGRSRLASDSELENEADRDIRKKKSTARDPGKHEVPAASSTQRYVPPAARGVSMQGKHRHSHCTVHAPLGVQLPYCIALDLMMFHSRFVTCGHTLAC